MMPHLDVDRATRFAVVSAALRAAHHVGDYWVQTNHQENTKGHRGREGALACVRHVATYTATTTVAVLAADCVFRLGLDWRAVAAGQVVSALTHYAADRREHGVLFWLADRMETRFGKATYAREFGGAPPLDQAWHHAFLTIAAGVTATGAGAA